MSLVLNLFAFIILLILFLKKSKHFLPFFIILNILLPSGLGFMLGKITLSLTRICSMVFPFLSITLFKTKKVEFKDYKAFLVLFSILIILSILSSLQSIHSASAYVGYIIDDILQTIGFIYLFVWASSHHDFDYHLILKSIISITLFSYILGVIEVITKVNIYDLIGISDILNKSYNGWEYRDDQYRISSIFTDTLQFGYYIAIIFPLLLLYIKTHINKNIYYYYAWICIIMSAPLIYYTGSRTSILMISTSLIILLSFRFWSAFSNSKSIKYLFFIVIFIVFTLSVTYFNSIFEFANNILNIKNTNGVDSSLKARNIQLDYVNILFDNNKFLFGQGRINTIDLLNNTKYLQSLDSMWIRLFLESGIFAPIIFLIILIIPVFRLIRILTTSKNKFPNEIFLLVAFLSYFIMSTFSSNNEMRFLFFILFVISIQISKPITINDLKKSS